MGETGVPQTAPRPTGKRAVAALVVLAAAVAVPLLATLVYPGAHRAGTAAIYLFTSAAAAALLGYPLAPSAACLAAGAIAAGWSTAALYAAVDSLTVTNVLLVLIELSCVATAPTVLQTVRRRLGRTEGAPASPAVVLAAAVLIPLNVVWLMRLAPALLAAVLPAAAAALARRPSLVVAVTALAVAFASGDFTTRHWLVWGLLDGAVLATVLYALRVPLTRLAERTQAWGLRTRTRQDTDQP
jgi:hypothetical protein